MALKYRNKKRATLVCTVLILSVILLHSFLYAPINKVDVKVSARMEDGIPMILAISNKYIPSKSEKYILEHSTDLGYASENDPMGCDIWKNANDSLANDLKSYQTDIDRHTAAIKEFKALPDLMKKIIKSSKEDASGGYTNTSRDKICKLTRLHPDGLQALFPSNQLSFTPSSGYIEPLLPPMRDSKFCTEGKRHLMSLDYLVHDFERMCRNLKPTSKRVLIDMGASLSFHGNAQPVVELLKLYEKFGFSFDHIYGFEIKETPPKVVYETLLPEKYLPSYHWINVGVNHTEGHRLNPLHSILSKFDEDDFIVVKLDIDTSFIEIPLAHQLLEGGTDGIYHKLVDHFYFEHHVHLGELKRSWHKSMKGSIKDSLELFYGLREKGIPSHFWP